MNNIVNTVPRKYFPQLSTSDRIKMIDTMLNMKYTNRGTHIIKTEPVWNFEIKKLDTDVLMLSPVRDTQLLSPEK